ncbi:MAG: alanine--glyoxylate aminotransferase family protein [Rhodospirillaceae bacterium]|nr:alanine--glyoxylate aminotransferase family protein [Rhodospirillaceae bacterium]
MQRDGVREPVITLSTGPVPAYPRVLQALSRPVHYDFDDWFQGFYESVAKKTARALRWDEPALILHAEPAVGLEAAAASLIGRRDVVLNLVSGVYGKGFGYWARRYAREVVEVEVPYNEAIDPQQVREALRRRPDTAVVSVVHHDTPSGTLNPVREIGQVVREHGALLLVDAVSSFGGMDIHPADCGADMFITGPNKCLGAPPGLTIAAVSERAWAHMAANPDAPRDSVLSVLDWKEAWRRDRPFPFTPSVAEVNALDAALDQYFDEGPEEVWRRHALTAAACRAGVKAMGLELWPAREAIAAPTTTAVRVPAGLADTAILAALRASFGVVFSLGRKETLGKLLRIGHMGAVAEPAYAIVAISALGGALRALGRNTDVGAGVEAAMAVVLDARRP